MKVLIVHNRYRSAEPSGENAVADDERLLLAAHGCTVRSLETSSDDIATWSLQRRASLPARVVWSIDGYGKTRAAIEQFGPDVVHFHNTFPLLSPSSLWAARRSGAAVVHTLHNFRALCPAGNLYRNGAICEDCVGRPPLPSLLHGCYRGSRLATAPLAAMDSLHGLLGTWRRCVDVFITPSRFARDKYVEAGWPAGRFAVKYNTVLDPGLAEGAGHGDFVYLGRISPEKGSDDLLAAWSAAFPKGERTLRLVGTVARGDDAAFDQRLPPGAVMLGQLDRAEALGILAGARALVVPSRSYEVFPRVIVEAYSLGVPVVASRVGPLPEIVDDGQTGLLFRSGSTVELAERLRLLATSGDTARRLGLGARRAFETKYAPDVTTEGLIEIYQRAIAAARRVDADARPALPTEPEASVPEPTR